VDHQRYSTDRVPQAKALISQRYGLKAPYFLYVSRLEHPAKNHLRLIQAFELFQERNSPWQLVFAGSDWTGAEVIHQAIEKSRCKNAIHSLGFVPDEVVPDLMRAADVFVYPSLYEGFGLPIAEAMACGCPVICSNSSSMLEVAGDAAATADPKNVMALKWQLLRLAGSPKLREQLSQAGLRQAKIFDWKRTAEASLKVYEQAARQTPVLTAEKLA
jgi:glycosyltransferase involved in cell wall biosynthesis